jgi:hypothetical protein
MVRLLTSRAWCAPRWTRLWPLVQEFDRLDLWLDEHMSSGLGQLGTTPEVGRLRLRQRVLARLHDETPWVRFMACGRSACPPRTGEEELVQVPLVLDGQLQEGHQARKLNRFSLK